MFLFVGKQATRDVLKLESQVGKLWKQYNYYLVYSLQLNEVFSLPSKRLFKIFSCGFFLLKQSMFVEKKKVCYFFISRFRYFLKKKQNAWWNTKNMKNSIVKYTWISIYMKTILYKLIKHITIRAEPTIFFLKFLKLMYSINISALTACFKSDNYYDFN